jgi:hypothetical protein
MPKIEDFSTEPDTGTSSIPFHKRVVDVHFHIFCDDFFEGASGMDSIFLKVSDKYRTAAN